MNERLNKAIEMLRPEAKEFVEALNNDPMSTTQNNYGRVLAMITRLQEQSSKVMAQCFLIAMIREGYSQTTARQLFQIMGW